MVEFDYARPMTLMVSGRFFISNPLEGIPHDEGYRTTNMASDRTKSHRTVQ